jgi:hypothetical protein
MSVDQPLDELQAFVATSTTYQEPTPVERSKSSTSGSIDIFDYQYEI